MDDTRYEQIVRAAINNGTALDFSFTIDPRYQPLLTKINQEQSASPSAVPVTGPPVESEQKPAPQSTQIAAAETPADAPAPVAPEPTDETEPGPLTEKEAIETVQQWVAQDDEVGISERRTFEEMVENLREAAEYRTTKLSVSRFEEIVRTYAPNAPHRNDKTESSVSEDTNAKLEEKKARVEELKKLPHPLELTPLIESGVAYHHDDFGWIVKQCQGCGNFKNECCGEISRRVAVRHDSKTLTAFGRQAVGLDPVNVPKPKTLEQIRQKQKTTWNQRPWWSQFRSVDEFEGTGNLKMYIENFLPEGITLIAGLPKEGKSWVALSIAKALTSGRPLLGRPGYEVPETVPVLYLAAESGDGALKLRCERMNITKDKTQFIARTLSQGPMFGLDDPIIKDAVEAMHPVVILETLVRFNDGTDEDSSTENRKLAESLFHLIAWGARAVIGIHHSRKDLNKANPTKEAAVRGSGDGLAMVDAVWLVMQDEKLFQGGKGPNEVELVGWGRDFNPIPMRLALTKKAPKLPPNAITFAPGIISCIDSSGDFEWVDKKAAQARRQELAQTVEQLVTESPTITRMAIAEATKLKEWQVRKTLKQLGYHRGKGDGASTQWVKGQGNDADLSS